MDPAHTSRSALARGTGRARRVGWASDGRIAPARALAASTLVVLAASGALHVGCGGNVVVDANGAGAATTSGVGGATGTGADGGCALTTTGVGGGIVKTSECIAPQAGSCPNQYNAAQFITPTLCAYLVSVDCGPVVMDGRCCYEVHEQPNDCKP